MSCSSWRLQVLHGQGPVAEGEEGVRAARRGMGDQPGGPGRPRRLHHADGRVEDRQRDALRLPRRPPGRDGAGAGEDVRALRRHLRRATAACDISCDTVLQNAEQMCILLHVCLP